MRLLLAAALAFFATAHFATAAESFAPVAKLISEHCLDCHAVQDPEGHFVMETFDLLMKGGESGPAIVAGKSSDSLLVKMMEGSLEKDGKKVFMPPGKRRKLTPEEIAVFKSWIDAGAPAPEEPAKAVAREIVTPKIAPKGDVRRPIHALAHTASGQVLAAARPGGVDLFSAESRLLIRNLAGHRGPVHALAFSADGKSLFAAGGEAGLLGEVRQWNMADGALVRTIDAHPDAIYALALSPDGKTLATGGYDQKIKLWNVETGQEIRTLSGHNGCVYGLSFRADGRLLASASGDRTVKLWDAATGERRDTLSQSLKEIYSVIFSPDGKRLYAGGVDNRIRVWEISEKATETTNPLLHSKFAHEGAILRLAFSPDGKSLASSAEDNTVKIWEPSEMKERLALEHQSDWPSALAFIENKALAVGRQDGKWQVYQPADGKVILPPKPEIASLQPRGIQRGVESRVRVTGKNLLGLTEVRFQNETIRSVLRWEAPGDPTGVFVSVNAPADLPRGNYEFSLVGANGESGRLALYVDDLPQLTDGRGDATLPFTYWGAHAKPGDRDTIEFAAKAGETIVFDVAAKRIGSAADTVLTLTDDSGRVLASNNGFDGNADPFLAHTFAAGTRARLVVSELLLGASDNHFFRLSAGALPFVTAVYPLSAPVGRETQLELAGFHLGDRRTLTVKPEKAGEMPVPIDGSNFRTRREFKLLATEENEMVEAEPNNEPTQANALALPAAVAGRIDRPGDADLFRIEAKAGQTWILETAAARRGSPVDTRIEVMHPDGKPVARVLLQAVRNSAITFRGIDSITTDCRVDNWEEMELNQYLYLQGEVVKLLRAPQGPDSGFLFYSGANGQRRNYFDTSATAHANEEACYIVEPHPPGTVLVPNGLPAFNLSYENDDEAGRQLGTDSKVFFTAPTDGTYLIRVTDTHGGGGDRFVYRLQARADRPDFTAHLAINNPTIHKGSGQSFNANVERLDGFDGEVRVEVEGLPPGFSVSTPIVIQAGHNTALATLRAEAQSTLPSESDCQKVKVTATALINGQPVTKTISNFGLIKLADAPRLLVSLVPEGADGRPAPDAPLEITIAPGQIVPAWLQVERKGHDDLITFAVDNLPHGIIVDNIGLSGVLIPKDQNERQIFFAAAKWVPETDRWCYAVENQAGRQTSRPVLIKVRKQKSPSVARFP